MQKGNDRNNKDNKIGKPTKDVYKTTNKRDTDLQLFVVEESKRSTTSMDEE